MSTMELELQKASLAREILTTSDEAMINNMWLLLKKFAPSVYQNDKPKKRKIGILDGKSNIVFHDDWSMTTEELLDLK
ncbi:hypothetical protein FACS189474_3390 [Bacteroidia bacterium]|nr:hypothetical protein FACS189423_07860 [Bacteroidia bacterium]GHT88336.1 hypothetical protein FACS189474_3390 [Bacteroidia bacterium]